MLEAISTILETAISERVFPGAVFGLVRPNGETQLLARGRHGYEADAPETREDHLFDLASITKSIPNACLALQLLEEGRLDPDQPLIRYLPEFNNVQREEVLIRHLLTYTLEGYGLAWYKDLPATEITKAILHKDFSKPPGTTFRYTNVPAYLLGLVNQQLYGQPLDVLADEHFFKPLGMASTTLHPERFPLETIVPTEVCDWRKRLVHGAVHDESAFAFKRDGVIVGHAGLFSSAPDLLIFLRMLLEGGQLGGRRYFKKETIALMHTNQIEDLGLSTGLGWELNQPQYMGRHAGPDTFGKTGFTGTVCVVDPKKQVAFALLSNRIHPKRSVDSSAINKVRAAVADIVLA